MQILKRIILSLLIFSIISCSQKPAKIVYKGNYFYGKNFDSKKSLFVKKASKKTKRKSSSNSQAIKVKSGDSLYSIAKSNKTSTRTLIELNNLNPPYKIFPGQTLYVPQNRATHIVTSGESLFGIARQYKISMTELAQLNKIKKPYTLKIGQSLALPIANNKSRNSKIAKKSQSKKKYQKKYSKKRKSIKLSKSKNKFIWPVKGEVISSFGRKSNGTHNDGINIKAKFGAPIRATNSGKIIYVGNELRGYGNLIIMKHKNGWLSAYAHNNDIFVKKNQSIKQGEIIGTIGNTGNVKTAQLHFGLRKGRQALNPTQYLN
jgi:murein DD-endopeptidase MepM/ murein hydrolase activator NlpD